MGSQRRSVTVVRVRQVRARIERWRRTRERRSPMPEPLWQAAVTLAETDGLYPTARALSLNYQSLKARVAEASVPTRRRPAAAPGFVELSAPVPLTPPSPAGPVVELMDGAGRKLTIRLPAEPAVDVERLAVHLLGRRRR